MQSAIETNQRRQTRRELVLLLAASLATVTALTGAIVYRQTDLASNIELSRLLLIAIVTGIALVAGTMVWRTTAAARQLTRKVHAETAELRRNLATAEAIIKAEQQVLMYWEHGQGLKVMAHTLTGIASIPKDQTDLLRFGEWLEPRSADGLKAGLDLLFTAGRPFSIIVKTQAGEHLDADGRAAGGRAVLRLRDVAGYRRDLSRIIDQHQWLARDIRSGRALLNALPMPVWLKNADGRISWVNKAYVAAVEAASEDEVMERQIELLESRQRQAMARHLAQASSYRERLALVVGGERKPHDVIVHRLEDACAGAAIDVAAIESAKGELGRQIAAYDRTLHRVATAVAIFDREQKLTFYNDAYLKLWRLDPDWLASEPSDGSVLDRLRELGRLPEMVNYREWKTRVLTCYQTGTEHEDWWHLPDGRILHVLSEQRPDGGVTYLFVDESERFALESNYNALINVQRETLDSLKEGVAVFGTDGRIKLHNRAFAQIWKMSRDNLETQLLHIDEFITLVQPLFNDTHTWRRISRAVTSFSDQRQPLEGQMVRPDLSVIDFATSPLPDGGTLITFADVTDAKRYERALVERNEALVAADKLKNQFIGHVSYELRTPLTNIIGFTELLTEGVAGPLNGRQHEYLGDIATSSKTLLSIIDDILVVATIDAGALELKLAPVDVREVTDAAIADVVDRARDAELTIDVAIGNDAATFIADEARVRRVLYNLLSNAVGFSHRRGTVRLTAWRENGHIVFEVEDHGIGIPHEQQQRLFQRFESRSLGSNHRGAGLGLSITKSLVEVHGGTLSIVSEPGKGTCATVRFPERGVGARELTGDEEAASPPAA